MLPDFLLHIDFKCSIIPGKQFRELRTEAAEEKNEREYTFFESDLADDGGAA